MNLRGYLRSSGELNTDTFSELQRWRQEASKWASASLTRIPLAKVQKWDTAITSPTYKHNSGMFFSVVGIAYSNENEQRWISTAMIDQPEIGLLGLVITQKSTGMAALVQAKAEPGTIGGCQLSPTVQATRSNQLRVHGGKPVPLLGLFQTPRKVILNTIQSEHGSIFWQKQNRSMIIEVPYFKAPPGFRWVGITDLIGLVSIDNLVHSNLRTVLSLGPFWQKSAQSCLAAEINHIQSWLKNNRSTKTLSVRRVPINDLEGWNRQHCTLRRIDGSGHEIIGVRVNAPGREIDLWDQLMIKQHETGLVALAIREHQGCLQALVRICVEAGARHFAEIGPTVQIAGGDQSAEKTQRELAHILIPDSRQSNRSQIHFDGLQSDDGGRFYQSEVRYVVVNCDIAAPSEHYRWCDVHALSSIARLRSLLNIQARDALVCLMSTLVR